MESDLKLLFVSSSAYALGGVATWVDYVLPGLSECGWNCTLGLVEGPGYHKPDKYLEVHPSAKVTSISCSTGTPYGRCRALVRTIQKLKPDLVVSVNIPDVYRAVQYLRMKGKPSPLSVMTLHGIQADLLADLDHYRGSIDAVVSTNRLACLLASEFSRIDVGRVMYAPCGVSLPPSDCRPSEQDPFRIVYSGRVEQEQKRIHDLPAILDQLSKMGVPFILEIAGSGPEEESLREALQPHMEAGRVRFLGVVSPDQLNEEVYPGANALLVTSRWETGPIVIWEAMSHQVPVVSSRYIGSGQEGALEHEQNALLFDIGDVQGAAEALFRLQEDRALAARLVRNGLGLVTERYSLEASISKWDEAFKATLKLSRQVPKESFCFSRCGRLDQLFGARMGEAIRCGLGRKVSAGEAAGEWPHCHVRADNNAPEFWKLAEKLDRRES